MRVGRESADTWTRMPFAKAPIQKNFTRVAFLIGFYLTHIDLSKLKLVLTHQRLVRWKNRCRFRGELFHQFVERAPRAAVNAPVG